MTDVLYDKFISLCLQGRCSEALTIAKNLNTDVVTELKSYDDFVNAFKRLEQFILNDKNKALEVAHAHNMGIESCREHVAGVEKILKSGPIVSICSRDGLKKKSSSDDVSWEDKADFGRLGIHKVEYQSLTFDTICNSKKCFGDNSAYTYTCPGFVKQ